MYDVTVNIKDDGSIKLRTSKRGLARAVYELGIENADLIDVEVVHNAPPRPVKFSGLAEQKPKVGK